MTEQREEVIRLLVAAVQAMPQGGMKYTGDGMPHTILRPPVADANAWQSAVKGILDSSGLLDEEREDVLREALGRYAEQVGSSTSATPKPELPSS